MMEALMRPPQQDSTTVQVLPWSLRPWTKRQKCWFLLCAPRNIIFSRLFSYAVQFCCLVMMFTQLLLSLTIVLFGSIVGCVWWVRLDVRFSHNYFISSDKSFLTFCAHSWQRKLPYSRVRDQVRGPHFESCKKEDRTSFFAIKKEGWELEPYHEHQRSHRIRAYIFLLVDDAMHSSNQQSIIILDTINIPFRQQIFGSS